MKKKGKTIMLIVIAVVVIIGIYLLSQLFTPREYYCGHGSFGGLIGASKPGTCAEEWKIIMKYKPFCEGQAEKHGVSWQEACHMILMYGPEAVCTKNMLELGINLTEEEKTECIEEANSL